MRRFQSFRLDTANQCLWHDETRTDLTPKAFDVLRYLVEHAGRLVTPDELLESLWPGTYVNPEDADVPGFAVFTKRDGAIRHFYSGEMSGEMADRGQDPRGAPEMDPLWSMLDYTREGRGTDWYPKLNYGPKD